MRLAPAASLALPGPRRTRNDENSPSRPVCAGFGAPSFADVQPTPAPARAASMPDAVRMQEVVELIERLAAMLRDRAAGATADASSREALEAHRKAAGCARQVRPLRSTACTRRGAAGRPEESTEGRARRGARNGRGRRPAHGPLGRAVAGGDVTRTFLGHRVARTCYLRCEGSVHGPSTRNEGSPDIPMLAALPPGVIPTGCSGKPAPHAGRVAEPAPGASDAQRDRARERMVRDRIEARGVRDERVLEAMRRVPRHRFVPERLGPRPTTTIRCRSATARRSPSRTSWRS